MFTTEERAPEKPVTKIRKLLTYSWTKAPQLKALGVLKNQPPKGPKENLNL